MQGTVELPFIMQIVVNINAFGFFFQNAMKENAKIRETEEKIRRAKEAKDRAQKDKAAKVARKKAIVDMTMGIIFRLKL